MLNEFLEFVKNLKEQTKSTMTKEMINSHPEYIPYLEYYIDKSNAPGIKKIVLNSNHEEFKDVDLSTLMEISKQLQSISGTKSKQTKITIIQDYSKYVNPHNMSIYVGLITFSMAIGVTKTTILKYLDKF